MRELTLREIQIESLNILLEFDKICQKHGIKYMLAFGTLIGAVRNKGFIPWDDDLDIWMKREDFDRFVELYENDSSISPYKLCTRNNTVNYFIDIPRFSNMNFSYVTENPYEKPWDCGAFIDLYPVDCCGNSEEDKKGKKELMNISKLYFTYMGISRPNPLIRLFKNVLHSFLKNIPKEKMIKYVNRKYEKVLNDMKKRSQGTSAALFDSTVIRPVNNEWLDDLIPMEFEGHMFPVPREYDKILTLYYRDYMTLPSEDKRVPHHAYKIYAKDLNKEE